MKKSLKNLTFTRQGKMETVSNYQISLSKWMAEDGLKGIIKGQTLLKATKVGKV